MRFGFWEILLIVALVFLLFGANKFPDMMRRLAEGMKVFKKEMGDEEAEGVKKVSAGKKASSKKPAKKKKNG